MNFLLLFFTFFKAANDFSPSQKALLETISFVSFVVALISALMFLLIVLPAQFYPLITLALVASFVVYAAYVMYTINLEKYKREERLEKNDR